MFYALITFPCYVLIKKIKMPENHKITRSLLFLIFIHQIIYNHKVDISRILNYTIIPKIQSYKLSHKLHKILYSVSNEIILSHIFILCFIFQKHEKTDNPVETISLLLLYRALLLSCYCNNVVWG